LLYGGGVRLLHGSTEYSLLFDTSGLKLEVASKSSTMKSMPIKVRHSMLCVISLTESVIHVLKLSVSSGKLASTLYPHPHNTSSVNNWAIRSGHILDSRCLRTTSVEVKYTLSWKSGRVSLLLSLVKLWPEYLLQAVYVKTHLHFMEH
jgi:hypothetical protein